MCLLLEEEKGNGEIMFIKAFTNNWYAYSNPSEYGENYLYMRHDMDHIVCIKYHEPAGNGDAHYCDVYFWNGENKRYFNINEIEFFSVEEKKKLNVLELDSYIFEVDR